jgi:hypothetical protein
MSTQILLDGPRLAALAVTPKPGAVHAFVRSGMPPTPEADRSRRDRRLNRTSEFENACGSLVKRKIFSFSN